MALDFAKPRVTRCLSYPLRKIRLSEHRFDLAPATESKQEIKYYIDSKTKRLFDVVISATALILLLPLMSIIIVLIASTSKGPVIYRQRRHGLNMRDFEIYKFRTMFQASAHEPFRQATKGDPRVTGVGRFLRKTSIDELPQLYNVLKGDMSIVGPRPHPIALDSKFGYRIEGYEQRFRSRPGITGLAQIKGARGETRTIEDMQRRLCFDKAYIGSASLMLDVAVVLGTIRELVASRTAF